MYKIIEAMDIIGKLEASLGQAGWGIDPVSQKMRPMAPVAVDPNKNWVYVNPMPDARCEVYQSIVGQFKFIPERCMQCWKVVVAPKTVQQLLAIYDWQKKFTKDYIGTDRFCKCGVEDRKFVPRNYGAYFYCDSLAKGLKRWKQVRDYIDGNVGLDLAVTLKRYCTEYEIILGPSDEYVPPADAEFLEDAIFKFLDIEAMGLNPETQPPEVIGHTVKRWLEFAWSIGDPTFETFNEGEPLYAPSVTYHPQPKEGDTNDADTRDDS